MIKPSLFLKAYKKEKSNFKKWKRETSMNVQGSP